MANNAFYLFSPPFLLPSFPSFSLPVPPPGLTLCRHDVLAKHSQSVIHVHGLGEAPPLANANIPNQESIVYVDREALGRDEGKQRGLHRREHFGGNLVEVRSILEQGGEEEANARKDVEVLVDVGEVAGLGVVGGREGGREGEEEREGRGWREDVISLRVELGSTNR